VEDDETGDEISHSISLPGYPGGIALSDSEKAEALADSLEAQFHPVTAPWVPAVEIVAVELRSSILTPAIEQNLTNPDEVQEAIRGLNVGKVPDPNGIPNRALKHLPK
jgi:hypothetical protein